MSAKFDFHFESKEHRRPLPPKLIIGPQEGEPLTNILLIVLSYVILDRERLQIRTNLHNDSITFVPDIVQLDYELRVRLWVEVGPCSITKLDKLAVKVPEAEIWIVRTSVTDCEDLLRGMRKHGLRTGRYHLLCFSTEMLEEMLALLKPRNHFVLYHCESEPPSLQFELNGIWFDTEYAQFDH
ncbi:MAG: hypothetical protein JWM04_489 [Verrucomicrobiales bacterium]|nr:hypothetical protein [Verrucomicrobiales bacterium]